MKRQKVIKDKDGNDVVLEEVIDQNGNKSTIKKKILKDMNGQDMIITE